MGKTVKCDFEQLLKYQKELNKLEKQGVEKIFNDSLREIGGSILSKTIHRTHVGIYKKGSGRVGGTLRRGWTISRTYKTSNDVNIDIINSVKYASYVEDGHRKRTSRKAIANRKTKLVRCAKKIKVARNGPSIKNVKVNNDRWIEGQFMLRDSIDEVDEKIPEIIERHIKKELGVK